MREPIEQLVARRVGVALAAALLLGACGDGAPPDEESTANTEAVAATEASVDQSGSTNASTDTDDEASSDGDASPADSAAEASPDEPAAPASTAAPASSPIDPAQLGDALATVEVPAMCTHEAGNLVDGSLPVAQGFLVMKRDLAIEFELDNDGTRAIAVPVSCSAGGVGLPEYLLIYDTNLNIIDWFNLADLWPNSRVTQAQVTSLESLPFLSAQVDLVFGTPQIEWSSYFNLGALPCAFAGDLDTGSPIARNYRTGTGCSDELLRESNPPVEEPVSCIEPDTVLGIGMPGPDERVRLLQQRLADRGFNPGEIDGYFGQNTFSAVFDFIGTQGPDAQEGVFIDEGSVFEPTYSLLGIACS